MPGAQIGYIRVSTIDQNTERQLSGVSLDKIFEDKASGKDANRPQLQACLEYCRDGDILYVHSIDRLARSLQDLIQLVKMLSQKGVTVKFLQENLTFTGTKTNDPIQMLMLQVMGACAEFERAQLRERQREGIAQAKAQGKHLGRRKILKPDKIQTLCDRAKAGENKSALAKEFGISRATLFRMMRKMS